MKNIETPRKKHAGKGIDGGGFEKKKKTMEQKEWWWRKREKSYGTKIFVGGANKSKAFVKRSLLKHPCPHVSRIFLPPP